MKNKKTKSVRLPSHISPASYKLTITPDLESFTFAGNEIIKIKINKEVRQITLHSKDIEVESSFITSGSSKKIIKQFTSRITYDTESETVTLIFNDKVKTGNYNLALSFKGIINEGLRGFYQSRYILDGETKHLATTQFEATDARRAFPCFDEPEQKAVFEVSLIIADKHTAISNTLPVEIKEHSAGYKIVSFAPTPRMSTYLLAFIIGEFEYVEGYARGTNFAEPETNLKGPRTREDEVPDHSKSLSGSTQTLVRVFTTAGKSHQAKFALEVAIKSLEFYNEYFDIPYPLPTLDLIAIPDFESAAMENWGAITFRETAILVDEENTSLSNRQWVAIVIAHELSHQWFGNLVTMKWWTDLWLNEGFATYMETFCVDKLFPEWHLWDLYLADRYALALRLDSLSNSHPIEIEVNHPDEINEIFDMVSYAKGGAMIRQLAEYIGDDKFCDGLRHYLKKHSYKNTNTIDLWESFEKVSKKPISKMMSAWTKEIGYPLVTVGHMSDIGTNSKINKDPMSDMWYVTQERFFSSRIEALKYKNSSKKKNIWPIPFKYESMTRAGTNEIMKLLMTKKTIPLIGTSIGKVNKEEDTMMRVRYDNETLKKLSDEIIKGTLSIKDRLGIIRDLFALAEGGYIKTDIALEFTLFYKDETEYIVWAEIAGGINRVYNLISGEPIALKYKKYVLSLFSPLAEEIGWGKTPSPSGHSPLAGVEEHSKTFLRNLALSMAAHYGDTKVIKLAQKLFKDRNTNSIHADIRGIVYGIVAANGGEKEWKLFEKLYIEEKLHEEKDRFARALGAFTDEKLLTKTLEFTLSSHIRNQDAPFIISSVWGNIHGKDLTWKFVKNNWKEISNRWGLGGHFLSRLLTPLGGHTSLKDLKDIQKFFFQNKAHGADRTLEQSYERIASNAAWIKDDKKLITNWLNKNYSLKNC